MATMMQPLTAALSEYARLLLELHALMREDRGDSEQGDAIRDAMDKPWYELTEEEKVIIRQLSADLDTLGDRHVAAEPDPNLLRSFERARDAGEWMTMLQLLQDHRMQHVSPAIRARLRGDAWFALGVPVAACLFYQDAFAALSTLMSPEAPYSAPVEPSTSERPRFPRYRIFEAA